MAHSWGVTPLLRAGGFQVPLGQPSPAGNRNVSPEILGSPVPFAAIPRKEDPDAEGGARLAQVAQRAELPPRQATKGCFPKQRQYQTLPVLPEHSMPCSCSSRFLLLLGLSRPLPGSICASCPSLLALFHPSHPLLPLLVPSRPLLAVPVLSPHPTPEPPRSSGAALSSIQPGWNPSVSMAAHIHYRLGRACGGCRGCSCPARPGHRDPSAPP